jgi:hypothetical protein
LKIGQVPIPLRENTHVFLTAGYVFKVSEQFKFKPALMSKYVSGAPISLDVTANVLYNENLSLEQHIDLEIL